MATLIWVMLIISAVYFFGKYTFAAFGVFVCSQLIFMGEWWSVPLGFIALTVMVAGTDLF